VANAEAVKSGDASPYYTNSTHLPVGYTDDLFEALDLQDNIQTKYTGGTVLHSYMGEAMPSAESVKKLVRKIATNYRVPYFTLTPTFSICPKHGYLSGEHQYCPKCDEESGYGDPSIVQDEIVIDKDIEMAESPVKPDTDNIERDIINALA